MHLDVTCQFIMWHQQKRRMGACGLKCRPQPDYVHPLSPNAQHSRRRLTQYLQRGNLFGDYGDGATSVLMHDRVADTGTA